MAPLSQIVTALAAVVFSGLGGDFYIDEPIIGVAKGISSGGAFSVEGSLGVDVNQALTNANYQLIGSFVVPSSNLSPAAILDSVTRAANDDLKIDLRLLLANDIDPESESLSIQVSAISESGIPLTVSEGWVYYRHTATVSDSFTYTITDPHGAISQGRVQISIGDPDSQFSTFLRIAVDASGAHILFTGILTRAYIIQSRDTLSDPWTDRATAANLGLGQFRFDDATGSVTRFYRVVYRP
jgi:hypothetical protein